jgi:hypothetical protein
VARKGEQAVELALPHIQDLFNWQNRFRRTLNLPPAN